MSRPADSFDLGTLRLSAGEARSIELEVPVDELSYGGRSYAAGGRATATLDVSRTMAGHALRLRFSTRLGGPCMRCLEAAAAGIDVDAREIDQPGDAEELRSPYVEDAALDLRAWARDALALALPAQIFCEEDCAGLCAVCGENLNHDPEHAHEPERDPRWAKLSELKLDDLPDAPQWRSAEADC
ncbi:MAG: YceD family protein [Thermoleophilaceae bacterium]